MTTGQVRARMRIKNDAILLIILLVDLLFVLRDGVQKNGIKSVEVMFKSRPKFYLVLRFFYIVRFHQSSCKILERLALCKL